MIEEHEINLHKRNESVWRKVHAIADCNFCDELKVKIELWVKENQ